MSRLVVVSNRVTPIQAGAATNIGGLAIALQDALRQRGGVWFGWSGKTTQETSDRPHIVEDGKVTYATIDLVQRDYDEYYTGFAHSVIWPLFHYRLHMTDFSRRDMAGYYRVNSLFAKHLLQFLRPDDVIWVHDYHFIPLAHYLRQAGSRNRIGFFLHIPWPPVELILALPNHDVLVRDLCGYDLIGFQTDRDIAAFTDYIRKEARGEVGPDGIVRAYGQRARIGVFPSSIDTTAVAELAKATEGTSQGKRLRDSILGRKLIVGVDRLDYTKGLLERMEAYDHFLTNYPNYRNNVVFIQVATQRHTDEDEMQSIKRQMESATGHINGRFADFDRSPIRYLQRALKRQTILGFLRASHVGLVTPLRDGMNLVAKEFVAAQPPKDPGVLVLSRFAGSARELDGSVLVNPYDVEGVAEALAAALDMPLGERKDRWNHMIGRLREWDLTAWQESYLAALRAGPCASVSSRAG